MAIEEGCIPLVYQSKYHVGHESSMLDCFQGTARGEVQPAVGSVQLAELLSGQLVVCLADAVCKHKCALTVTSIDC